jgi:hypothetical protein
VLQDSSLAAFAEQAVDPIPQVGHDDDEAEEQGRQCHPWYGTHTGTDTNRAHTRAHKEIHV